MGLKDFRKRWLRIYAFQNGERASICSVMYREMMLSAGDLTSGGKMYTSFGFEHLKIFIQNKELG